MLGTQQNAGHPSTFEPVEPQVPDKRRDVEGVLHFVKADVTAEEIVAQGKAFGANPNTWGAIGDSPKVNIQDVRGRESEFTLEGHGFQYVDHKSALTEADFDDQEKIKAVYYDETMDLVKKMTGAKKVIMWNHMTRMSHGHIPRAVSSKEQNHGQALRVHVDQDTAQVRKHLEQVATSEEELAEFSKKRFGIINVWRPIRPVYKDPLAIADLNTQTDKDIVSFKLTTPDGLPVSVLGCKSNPSHQFFYMHGQRPDEPLLFKQFDSAPGAKAYGRVPHTAFVDDEYEMTGYPRRSIEARCVVVWEDEEGLDLPESDD